MSGTSVNRCGAVPNHLTQNGPVASRTRSQHDLTDTSMQQIVQDTQPPSRGYPQVDCVDPTKGLALVHKHNLSDQTGQNDRHTKPQVSPFYPPPKDSGLI